MGILSLVRLTTERSHFGTRSEVFPGGGCETGEEAEWRSVPGGRLATLRRFLSHILFFSFKINKHI